MPHLLGFGKGSGAPSAAAPILSTAVCTIPRVVSSIFVCGVWAPHHTSVCVCFVCGALVLCWAHGCSYFRFAFQQTFMKSVHPVRATWVLICRSKAAFFMPPHQDSRSLLSMRQFFLFLASLSGCGGLPPFGHASVLRRFLAAFCTNCGLLISDKNRA